MDPDLRKAFVKGTAKNDQAMAALLDLMRNLYKEDAVAAEEIRRVIFAESNAFQPNPEWGQIGLYLAMRDLLLTIGCITLQAKMAEWLESGEISLGTI